MLLVNWFSSGCVWTVSYIIHDKYPCSSLHRLVHSWSTETNVPRSEKGVNCIENKFSKIRFIFGFTNA